MGFIQQFLDSAPGKEYTDEYKKDFIGKTITDMAFDDNKYEMGVTIILDDGTEERFYSTRISDQSVVEDYPEIFFDNDGNFKQY